MVYSHVYKSNFKVQVHIFVCAVMSGRDSKSDSSFSSSTSSTEDLSGTASAAQLKPSECSSVKSEPAEETEESSNTECAVCLQSCVHPVRLPCSHIFCYLCVKGVAFQSKRCAMCRQRSPPTFYLIRSCWTELSWNEKARWTEAPDGFTKDATVSSETERAYI